MSYVIEYDRQFIKSGFGYTPVWLAGDNNVYVTKKKRDRTWDVFHKLIGVTKDAIVAAVEPALGGYQEHWKHNGKWVDDKALLRWIDNGCKNAATIEEIITFNRFSSVNCRVVYFNKENHRFIDNSVDVTTTLEFDQWIADAKALMHELREKGLTFIYPAIQFYSEDPIVHPTRFKPTDEVHVKHGTMFLSEYDIERNAYSWVLDKCKAITLTPDKAIAFIAYYNKRYQDPARPVKATDSKKNYVVQIVNGTYETYYIQKITSRRVRVTSDIRCAHKYSTTAQAKRVVDNAYRYNTGDMRVVEVEV